MMLPRGPDPEASVPTRALHANRRIAGLSVLLGFCAIGCHVAEAVAIVATHVV